MNSLKASVKRLVDKGFLEELYLIASADFEEVMSLVLELDLENEVIFGNRNNGKKDD